MAVAEHPQPAGHGEAGEADPLAALQGFLTPTDYDALTKCVHCGLCLNVCPTYRQNGLEADSPRGRLYLMRAVAEGDLDFSAAVNDHLQLCLQCRACETACPSNVHFGQVMEGARATILDEESTRLRRVLTWAVFGQLFAYPTRLVLLGNAPALLSAQWNADPRPLDCGARVGPATAAPDGADAPAAIAALLQRPSWGDHPGPR